MTRVYSLTIDALAKLVLDHFIRQGKLMPGRFDVEFELDELRLQVRVSGATR